MTSWYLRMASALALAASASLAAAQAYPTKPIQMIVPLGAGSSGDAMLRLLAQDIGTRLKQPIYVDNQPGAAGLIGAQRLARAAPDGYTIGGMSDSVVNYAPSLAAKLEFNPLTDFEPISHVASVSWVLVVNPTLPASTVAELVALLKSQPDKFDYASAGNGSPHQVVMELFKAATGTKANHIPYKGAAQAVTDVVSGQVPIAFQGISVAAPFVKQGKLRALAVLGSSRSNLLPDVPTMSEAGVPLQFQTWVGVYAPKGTPAPIIAQLNAEVAKSLAEPQVRDKLVSMGFDPRPSTPAELGTQTREGLERVTKVVRAANIKADQ